MTIVPRKCPVETCDRIIYTAKYCAMHMKRLMRGNDPHARSRNDNRPIIDNDDGTSLIPLQKGAGYATIDTSDRHLVEAYKFHTTKRCSVDTSINGKKVKIHHLLLGKPDGDLVIDHIDGNHLNNSRSNLRIIPQRFNAINQRKHIAKTSIYKGVCLSRERNSWEAGIMNNRKKIYIGRYKTEIEAAKAYNAKAFELWGEYAYLNDV